jgi:hypothetical protein
MTLTCPPVNSTLLTSFQEHDFRRLLQQGRSADPTPQRGNSPIDSAESSSTGLMQTSNHLFSRHSLIGQMQLQDDGADMTIRTGLDRRSHRRSSPSCPQEAIMAGSDRYPVYDPLLNLDTFDLSSFDVFHGDLDDMFGLDTATWAPYEWPQDTFNNST